MVVFKKKIFISRITEILIVSTFWLVVYVEKYSFIPPSPALLPERTVYLEVENYIPIPNFAIFIIVQ